MLLENSRHRLAWIWGIGKKKLPELYNELVPSTGQGKDTEQRKVEYTRAYPLAQLHVSAARNALLLQIQPALDDSGYSATSCRY